MELHRRVMEALGKPEKLLEPLTLFPKQASAASARLRPALFGAERYMVDTEVSWLAGGMGAAKSAQSGQFDEAGEIGFREAWDDPELLLAAMPSSWPPADRCWFEFDSHARFVGSAPGWLSPDDDAPRTGGFLIERVGEPLSSVFRMTAIFPIVAGKGAPAGAVEGSPVSIVWDTSRRHALPTDEEDEIVFLGKLPGGQLPTDPMARAYRLSARMRTLFGALALNSSGLPDIRAAIEDMGAHAVLAWSPYTGRFVKEILAGGMSAKGRTGAIPDDQVIRLYRKSIDGLLNEHAGDWRFAIALLALTNARVDVTRKARTLDARHRDAALRGKVKPYHEHYMVSLAVPREKVVGAILNANDYLGSKRRRHGVVETWCWGRIEGKNKGDPSCAHTWDEPGSRSMTCTSCGQKKWRRKAHERGDASLGYVTKDRLLTSAEPVPDAQAWSAEQDDEDGPGHRL
jgi:hypothetical protein